MVKIIEPQGVPCKKLKGNPYPFETHKIEPRN